jgi:uncharacterized membrane protein
MAFELRAPHGATISAVRAELPGLLVYLLSFAFVGIYWNNHHHLLRAATRISGAVMWTNLFLLFWLSLIPVLTEWLRDEYRHSLPAAAYGVVALAAGLAFILLGQTLIRANGPDSAVARAIAVKAGSTSSSAAEANFIVIPSSTQPPAAPVIFPNGGTFTTCPAVTLTTPTAGASIFYTLDGSAPTMNSAAYSAAIQLTTSAVVRAAAFLSATSASSISQASFTVNCQPAPLPAPVTISPGGGVFTGSVDITLSSTPGAVIYYTLDGSTPTASTLVYGGPIHLTRSAWVRSSAIQGTYSTPAAERYFTVQ